ncbi:1-deoxy-D-xylulose-5-phosphate synthase, chloroplastic-like [Vicia villosa]|uniref:1-deoxy-D-xylulose-5-phosphate synthase, chloroplastic-like n=1 Tax=Vicia villosa TaxID=3911 RepID=UPI00273CAB17|nr:1-deoxy-D-xylulose-5-phosphate synthase, chloroplastic-like [Vicia villosa]
MHELEAKVDEELGLYYIGPMDGHNIEDLICVLQEVASLDLMGPVLVHVITDEKQVGGHNKKSNNIDKQQDEYVSYDLFYNAGQPQAYGDCFVDSLVVEAEKDKDIVVVRAGITSELSLELFRKIFLDRIFNMGVAEQHAITFVSGLSCGRLKPFCIIQSSLLQRAYDQIVHDVDQQKILVRFVITSARLVGSDGPVQWGAFDITFMSCLPNMIVMALSDKVELVNMVATATRINDRPVCFQYPRGSLVNKGHTIDDGIPIEN